MTRLYVARHDIAKGELIEIPDDCGASADVVAAGFVETYHGQRGDLSIVGGPDVTPEEGRAAVGAALGGMHGVMVPIEMPNRKMSVDEFFDELPTAAAETIWKRSARVCTRCGEERLMTEQLGDRILCAECRPLER